MGSRPALLLPALALGLNLSGGCSLLGVAPAPGLPVSEAHAGRHDLRILDLESPLRARGRIPVLSTPEVFAVYVPSHVERDLLIGEHWLFLKLRDAEWFIERLQDPDPPADGDAPPESMRPLRDLDWSTLTAPHRGTP